MDALQQVRASLKSEFVGRDIEVDGMLIALLSSQHVLLLGPPGTAKSLLARRLCARLAGAEYFEWLLTKFTTPEELFGPVSLPALEAGRYERVLDRKLPRATVAFLDEVFKANSAILNALLTILNERRFHHGAESMPVPLETLVAASNELPEEDELRALQDRFLLRFQVGYVDDRGFAELLRMPEPSAPEITLDAGALARHRAAVDAATVPDAVLNDIGALRQRLLQEGITPSDRRFRTSLQVLKAAAVLQGRDAVQSDDLRWLAHVLWTDPEEQPKVRDAIEQLARGQEEEARKLRSQALEVHAYALRPWPDPDQKARAALEAHTKLAAIVERLASLVAQADREGRDAERLRQVESEVEAMQTSLLGEAS